MRLIDADALAAHMFHGYGTEITPVNIDAETYKLGWNDAIEAIMDNAPTIEPEQRTGEWEEIAVISDVCDIIGVKTWASRMKCDQCGFRHTAIEGHMAQYNYCPNCGAKMRGEQE